MNKTTQLIDEDLLVSIISKIKHQFEAIVDETYYLYKRTEGSHFISMVPPNAWGPRFEMQFLSEVAYTASNSWKLITTV
tara:strand:- start:3178 stop:3414 length:237 start_codon:yes stop_codon:yes gene_type:complete